MEKESKRKIINRMNYAIGHLEGVKKMFSEDKYCIDIIEQNIAVMSALEKINELVLENHLNTCVTAAIKGEDKKEREQKINELLKIFKKSNKI